MTLPPAIEVVVQPLFSALPLDKAMDQLVVKRRSDQLLLKMATDIVAAPDISTRYDLAAGIWLYVDELEPSHRLSQSIASQTGSFWHAILHRREGDFANASYWYRAAGHHPAMDRIPGYDSSKLVALAESGDNSAVAMQRTEWSTLFEWCAFQPTT